MSEPDDDSWSANSTNNPSMTDESTVPRLDMDWERSRISSSPISSKSLDACSESMASMKMAAFWGPERLRRSSFVWAMAAGAP